MQNTVLYIKTDPFRSVTENAIPKHYKKLEFQALKYTTSILTILSHKNTLLHNSVQLN